MKLTLGAIAHVDAGKTTLSESILYKTNAIRNKGRVDHKDAFLDFNPLEKEKGITIYNKQAFFKYKDKEYIYLDTPGHSDLAFETNRALQILDCAILIISAIEDIPTDTIKQFNNLLNYNIPILLFVNKMDISNYSKQEILSKIKEKLSSECIDYKDSYEHLSLLSDDLLNEYLSSNKIDDNIVINSLKNNYFFPCFFGSALKDEGVDELLDYIDSYIRVDYNSNDDLNAYLFKINNEYSYIKILSGTLNNKDTLGQYKINEIYDVSGINYTPIQKAQASDIVAVKGLKDVSIGTYLPSFNVDSLFEVPSLTYRMISSLDNNELFKKLESIIMEFPELKINLENNNIYINLNGELHQTIVSNLIKERINVDVSFSNPIIKYKETINEEIFGVGHFEPLRHYGEVIVKLKPIDNGIQIKSLVNNSYTNTLVSYLRNYNIRGILTNSSLTNVEITIVEIKTHPKHTEGGDLIQSTRRAIRHALSKTDSILLEPSYLTSIDINENNTNTIISYLTNLKLVYTLEESSIITKIPLISFNDILINLKSKLKGNLSYSIENIIYESANNQEEIMQARGYDYRSDMRNPAGSIFCSHGAGHYVEPEDVEDNMHLDISLYLPKQSSNATVHNKAKINEDELKRVWNNLYKPKPRYIPKKIENEKERIYKIKPSKPLMYFIDGYNLMYYLNEELATSDLINAREKTIEMVSDFAGYVAAETILVFDAYIANGSKAEVFHRDNITIVYTKEKQTADSYIEIKSKELKNDYKVIVVTSDNLEQLRVFSNDASIISSREFISRYENFRKNNSRLNTPFVYKPFKDLKQILELED